MYPYAIDSVFVLFAGTDTDAVGVDHDDVVEPSNVTDTGFVMIPSGDITRSLNAFAAAVGLKMLPVHFAVNFFGSTAPGAGPGPGAPQLNPIDASTRYDDGSSETSRTPLPFGSFANVATKP
jgi:hypothetical protein